MSADLINASFELAASLFICRNIVLLARHKMVRGTSISTVAFFFIWGLWNLAYYPMINQPLSFIGGCMVVTANLVWIGLAMHYARRERLGVA